MDRYHWQCELRDRTAARILLPSRQEEEAHDLTGRRLLLHLLRDVSVYLKHGTVSSRPRDGGMLAQHISVGVGLAQTTRH
jgi:hypothetical protein